MYIFLVALGLCCCVQTFSSCGEWGLLSVAVCWLLIAVASLVKLLGAGATVIAAHGLSSCGSRALKRVAPAVVHTGSVVVGQQALVAPQHVESTSIKDQTHIPCIGRQMSIHCTTREVHIFKK